MTAKSHENDNKLAQPMGHELLKPQCSVQCPNCKLWFFYRPTSDFKGLLDHIHQSKNTESCKNIWAAAMPDAKYNLIV